MWCHVCVCDCVQIPSSKRHLTSSHSARRGPTSSLRRDLSPVPSRSSQSEKLHPWGQFAQKKSVSSSVCSLNSLNCCKMLEILCWRAGDWCCRFLNVMEIMECYWIILEITVTQPWPARLTSQTSRGRRCHRRKVGSNVANNDSRSGSTGPHLALHTFQFL